MAFASASEERLRDGRTVVVRSASPEDAAALLRHLRTVVADGTGLVSTPEELRMSVAEERSWIRGFDAHADQLLLVAEHDGIIIGDLDFQIGKRRRVAHVGVLGMAVAPGYRGAGLGSALMRRLMEWAEPHPRIERITLAVLADNARALALYRKFGFVEEGRQVREVKLGPDEYADEVLMARWVGP